jgi:cholesterol oxidase
MLGATEFPFSLAPYDAAPKTLAMKEAADALRRAGRTDLTWRLPKLAISFGGDSPAPSTPIVGDHLHGAARFRRACRLCGECDIGCNDGAKNSLDYNYLSLAHAKGADIRVRHDAKEFEHHPDGGYVVRYRDLTDCEGADPKHAPRGAIRCKVLVVSAGALGSTYLMLANEQRLGGLPSAIGTKFCGNGDLLGFIRIKKGRVLDGARGPVITSTMRVGDALDPDEAATGRGFYLQDGGYPGFADWILETSTIPNRLWRSIKFGAVLLANRIRHKRTNHLSLAVSQLIAGSSVSSGSLPVLGMGRDVPDGMMHLDGDWLEIDWNVESSREYFGRVKQLMEQVARELDGELNINPTWWLKRVVTVHPLGGCPMGTHRELPPVGERGAPGVVDDHGEVFGHPGLFVADGAVMPGPVGPNPALTIAALAERFSRRMIERAA